MALAFVACAGCVGGNSYREYLDSLPTVEIMRTGDALQVAAPALGLAPVAIGRVSWIVDGMRRPGGEPIAGAQMDCDVWIEWWGRQWTSGASADGPAISYTAFAHELAHCALWLRDEDDPTHSRVDWWAAGGRVEQANAALVAAGL